MSNPFVQFPATGTTLCPADRLGRLLSESATLQKVTSSRDADAVFRDIIHIPWAEDREDDKLVDDGLGMRESADGKLEDNLRPEESGFPLRDRIVLRPGQESTYRQIGVQNTWIPQGTVEALFQFWVPAKYGSSEAQAQAWCSETFDQIWTDVRPLAGQGAIPSIPTESHFNMTAVSLQDGPWLDTPEFLGDSERERGWALYVVEWK